MKKLVVIAGGAAMLLALIGCLDQGGGASSYKGPLVRYHFVGRASLGKDGTATVLKQVDGLKETGVARAHFGQRLGAVAAELWKDDLPAGVEPQPGLLQPLIEDLTSVETLVEIHGPIGRTETLIAVELTDERARLWDTNLFQLARAWKLGTPAASTVEGAKGWTIRRSQAPGLQVLRVGKWTIVGIGSERITAVSNAVQEAVRTGRPMAAKPTILDLQADLPGLKKWFPVLAQFPLAPVHLTMVGRAENVRTEMRVMYAGRIPWKFEPWQIPTNLVSELQKSPLTSFTVAQGVRPFLEKFEGLAALGVPMPNQYCSWGMFHLYGHTFFAVPQAQASNTLFRISTRFPEAMKHYFDNPLGQYIYATNRGELAWGGAIPGISPTLGVYSQPGQEFIYARLFPLLPGRTPPPAGLFAQFTGRTNLFYYDWEITSNRVAIARQIYQLGSIFNHRPPPSIETPSQKWLAAIAPMLGESVTEITQTSAQELTLVRKAQIGLTGFEIATLSVWLESQGFPHHFERPPPFRLDKLKRDKPGEKPGAAPSK